jgi:hypothetical protein
MCFPRKPSLGRYSGTREQWAIAFNDPLAIPALDRLAAKKIIDSILNEESNTPRLRNGTERRFACRAT